MNAKKDSKENSLGHLTSVAGKVMEHTLRRKLDETGVDITVENWGVLFNLWRKDGVNQQELAKLVFKDKATVTRAIQSLERQNVVIRITDERDKRNKRIYLTHKGKTLEKQVLPLAMQTIFEATQGVDGKDLEICKKVLRQIFENLNK